jgi:hypothetical protein
MPVKRLGAIAPAANSEVTLATADVVGAASVIVTNRGELNSEVTIYVEPVESPGSTGARSYMAANLVVAPGQTFETFRFALKFGDKIWVSSTTGTAAFSATAAYEQVGRSNISYQPLQPGFPDVGDIWVNSDKLLAIRPDAASSLKIYFYPHLRIYDFFYSLFVYSVCNVFCTIM